MNKKKTKNKIEINGHMWNGVDIVPFGPKFPPVKWKGKSFPKNFMVGSVNSFLGYNNGPCDWKSIGTFFKFKKSSK